MAYAPPSVVVNQVATPPSTNPISQNLRTVAVVGPFPQGPALSRITPAGFAATYGDPTNAANAGYSGMQAMRWVASQSSANPAYGLSLIGVRTGIVSSTGTLASSGVKNPFSLQGIGQYAGSKGTNLQIVVVASQVVVAELQRGNAVQPEIQSITIYGIGGSPTGGLTLQSGNSVANTAITAASLAGGGGAGALQTYLTSISSIGSGNVIVTILPQATPGARSFQVTSAGTQSTNAQPLLGVFSNTIAAGTGAVPMQNLLVNDISSGSPVTLQQFPAALYDGFQVNGVQLNSMIVQSINTLNDPLSPNSVVQALSPDDTSGQPITQTIQLSGGSDGLGTLATDATIAPLLAILASGALGNVDFVVSGYDADAILPSLQVFTSQCLPNNIFPKFVLGPQVGTTTSTLLGGYQVANSDRYVMVGHGALSGLNPVYPSRSLPIPGYLVAAGIAGLKATTSAEFNLFHSRVAGLSNTPPMDPSTGVAYTPAQLQSLATAGYTVFQYSGISGGLEIRDLISTASTTNQFGDDNMFLRFSTRDCFDMIALGIVGTVYNRLGQPTGAPAQLVSTILGLTNGYLATVLNRYHTGATATVTFDGIHSTITINVGYNMNPILASIVLNVQPLPAVSISG